MKRMIYALLLAVLTACAAAPTPQVTLSQAYDTANAYVQMTTTSLQRGRITPEQAVRARANAQKLLQTLDTAKAALAGCKPAAPCTEYTDILQSLQPTLYELERDLRAQQQQQQGAKP